MITNNWMVIYYNGRSTREKLFDNKVDAILFIDRIEDTKATLWKLQETK